MRPLTFLLLPILALMFGCANLGGVRSFAKMSAASADYQQVVADYVESPGRQELFEPQDRKAELEEIAKRRAGEKARLEAAQTVLVKYMSVLGDMADDKLPNVDENIDGVTKALEGAKFVGAADAKVSKETAGAAADIGKILVRAILDHWRQAQVADLIKKNDGNVQTLTAGLKEIMNDLALGLKNESEAVENPFKAWESAAKSHDDAEKSEAIARILAAEHLREVKTRQDRVEAYIKVLDKIGKGHADLAAHVDKLDAKDLEERLKSYSTDIQTLRTALQQLAS